MADKELKYSRNEVVAELTSFYELLVKMYLPSSAIKWPPPGGWADLIPEYFAFMRKTDAVVDVLRHIPYVRDTGLERWEIYHETGPVDYTGHHFRIAHTCGNPSPAWTEPPEELTIIPSHVVCLAEAHGRYGCDFFLDTERGTITLCDFQNPPTPTDLSEVSVSRSPPHSNMYFASRIRLVTCFLDDR